MLPPTSLLGGGDIRVAPERRIVEGSRAAVTAAKKLEVVPRQHDGLDTSLENDVNAEVINTIATVDDDRAKNINKATVESNRNVVLRQNDGLDNSLENDAATDAINGTVNNLPQVTTVDDRLAKPQDKQSLEEGTHRSVPMDSPKVLLDRYEQLLKNHLLELGVCRGVYLRASARVVNEDTSGEVAEHDEVNAKLKEAMRILELSSRSTRSIVKESTLPEEATARDARVRMWEATLGRKTSASKLLLLEQELRSLECIVPILRYSALNSNLVRLDSYSLSEILLRSAPRVQDRYIPTLNPWTLRTSSGYGSTPTWTLRSFS